ncbi:MAG: DUF4169 family protein [Pseudomonadota bacterium]
MAEVVNLRMARKRAARSKSESQAAENRVAYGITKSERDRTEAIREKASEQLEGHRIEHGDRR